MTTPLPTARRLHLAVAFAGLLAAPLVAPSATAQEEPAAPARPAVTVEAITVTPGDPEVAVPGVDTLVQLAVRVANHTETTVTALHFRVTVGGVALPVYDKQNFLVNVPAGGETEVELYNFWTTETGRPAPADGKLAVEVTLDEAYPVTLTTEEDGTEVWTLGDPLPGLDSTKRLVIELAKTSAEPTGTASEPADGA